MLVITSVTALCSYQQTDVPESGMGLDTDHQGHAHRDIVHPAPGRQDTARRDTVHRTTATCHTTEPDTGDAMQVITGAGTTTLRIGGSGQPLRP